MAIIKYTIAILGSIFVLYVVGMILWHEVGFHETIYLNILDKEIEKYFHDDFYKADKYVIVNVSSLKDNKEIMEYIKYKCHKEWLDATNGNVILGYKNGVLHSIGVPQKHWDWCGTGKPSIVIPITVNKINAISFEFRDVEFINKVYRNE